MPDQDNFLKQVYRLRENPFTDHSGATSIDYFVGREKQKADWTRVVDGRKASRGSSLNFIVGDYGYGKTFSLWLILEQYKNDKELLGVYTKLLREDLTPKFGIDLIQRILAAIDRKRIDVEKAKKELGGLPKDLRSEAAIIAHWLNGDEIAELFLTGKEQLKAADLKKLDLRQNIKSFEVARVYFMILLFVLRKVGIMSLLICVDEVEYLFSQMRGAKVGSVINSLRALYDMPTSPEVRGISLEIANLILFFGISQSGWTNLANLERTEVVRGGPIQPLMSRVQRIIELDPLSVEEVEHLIERRLRFNRATKRFEKELLIPYTSDFVEYIYKLTLGNPREVVVRCDYTLEHGLDMKVPKLTREFARKVMESHALPMEPIEETTADRSRKRRVEKATSKLRRA